MDELPDTWLTVWEEDGSSYTVDEADEPRLDAAVSQYIDSGGTRDTLLSLDFTDGRTFRVKASRIAGWSLSTPATRRRHWELQKYQRDEDAGLKAEIGIIFEDLSR